MSVYRFTVYDPRFDELPDEERVSKIKDLFESGELRLDTDKRVTIMGLMEIHDGQLQDLTPEIYDALIDDLAHSWLIYEERIEGDKGKADKKVLDVLHFILNCRAA